MENEKQLIDANALLDLLRPLEGVSQIIKKILLIVRNCPTVDAVEVVRCKDCVHRKERVCAMPYAGMWVGVELKDSDFCSYGERKENG